VYFKNTKILPFEANIRTGHSKKAFFCWPGLRLLAYGKYVNQKYSFGWALQDYIFGLMSGQNLKAHQVFPFIVAIDHTKIVVFLRGSLSLSSEKWRHKFFSCKCVPLSRAWYLVFWKCFGFRPEKRGIRLSPGSRRDSNNTRRVPGPLIKPVTSLCYKCVKDPKQICICITLEMWINHISVSCFWMGSSILFCFPPPSSRPPLTSHDEHGKWCAAWRWPSFQILSWHVFTVFGSG